MFALQINLKSLHQTILNLYPQNSPVGTESRLLRIEKSKQWGVLIPIQHLVDMN